jgi:hypothetical protein
MDTYVCASRGNDVTPHPTRDGSRKRRRGPPSPLGRGRYHARGGGGASRDCLWHRPTGPEGADGE